MMTTTSLLDIEHWFEGSTSSSTSNWCFMLRRTPRRKLVFSSSDDETDHSPQSISSVHIVRHDYQVEQLTRPTELPDVNRTKPTRSKLEHYGFQQLARPVALSRSSKRPITSNTTTKRLRAMNITPNTNKSSRHPMQTRSQSSTDSHSDQLVKLFDQSLSTVTPNRDDEEETNRCRLRRARPLPLCLSDNEKNLPVLTVITNEETCHANKRVHDDDEEDSDAHHCSVKRPKVTDESNKENHPIINRPSLIKRSRRGIDLTRTYTEPNEEQIKASVELGSNGDLIGDRSRKYLLPRCKSRKHPDLACISPETMVDVLRGAYSSEIEQLHIIDCRYPYEYEGGHIDRATNLYTRSQVFSEYFTETLSSRDPTKRLIFIFHCEFSSERAPALFRYFRSEDRTIHQRMYPQLHYPEVYLLEGGYKAFFEYSREFCVPQQYRTMIDGNFQDAYQEYRSHTKQNEKFTGGRRRVRVSNFRSCLSFSSQSTTTSTTHRSSNLRYDLRYTGSPPADQS